MGILEDFLGGPRGAFGQGQLGMNQQQHIAQQSGLRGMAQREIAAQFGPGLWRGLTRQQIAAGRLAALSPPSFEDWICTPNTETYQEYQERRLPSTHNTSTTPSEE